jgi:hypothetical protein
VGCSGGRKAAIQTIALEAKCGRRDVEDLVRAAVRLLSALALALTLAGCDKCGNFGFQAFSSLDACRNTVPQQ